MKDITIAGVTMPALGLGTWNMGDSAARRGDEITSLRMGLDAGLRLIDTAEIYGQGRSETLVGEAIAGRRDQAFLVSKVYPGHASAQGVQKAARASLKRLGCERLDLYLLHWPGSVPLSDTIEGFERLRADGLIGAWGVSNFDADDMAGVEAISRSCAVNQILYSLEYRGVEFDLLARDRQAGVVTMAYSPVGQGGALLEAPVLARIAARHETASGPATPGQIALAWVLRRDNVIAIPKAGTPANQRRNIEARSIVLGPDDLAALDAVFAPPRRRVPLAML